MGCVSGMDCYRDERPFSKVAISREFYLGKYEVTQAQWEEVMGSNRSYFEGIGDDDEV